MLGLLGTKVGMTQVFDADGRRVAVTVIEAGPCVVTQCKTQARDGYEAVQLAFKDQKAARLSKPVLGHLSKAGIEGKQFIREFATEAGEEWKAGDSVTTEIFQDVAYVDITGITKGRGFAGVVKRHRMAGGRMTHGGHSKRRVGAIGQCSYPARVAKGQRMPGHMGNVRVTTQNLRVVGVDGEKNLILVSGSVPGPAGALVEVRQALKKAGKSA